MFYFYGRKKRIVGEYPKPKYDTIIEPFSGSAAYACEYHDRNVIIVEKDKKISTVWDFLINASDKDILGLPIVPKGESLNDPKYAGFSDGEIWTVGLFLNPGSSTPKKSPGKFCKWDENMRAKLVLDARKVNHWKLIKDDYTMAPDIEATWYIDPPYQGNGGQYYMISNKHLDYVQLADWCRSRKGQIIVCENSEADWMDFKPLIDIQGQKHKTKEVIWTNQ